MKHCKSFILAIAAFVLAIPLSAQEVENIFIPEGYELTDSLIYVPIACADTTLQGKNIFDVLPSKMAGDMATVRVSQSMHVKAMLSKHIDANKSKLIDGYRIRIFFDNRQSSRSESVVAFNSFKRQFPGIAAYRSYTSPYFKVTVGDFRTRSEAASAMDKIKRSFPSAFLVKEKINYPSLERENAFTIDTLKVLRKIEGNDITIVND